MASKTRTLSSVVNEIAEETGRDARDVGRTVRNFIRSNFDGLVEQGWEQLAEAKKNRDGNRYPEMPAKIANRLFDKFAKSSQAEDEEDEEDTDE